MSTSQRVSRGFHRLGLVMAAVPLLLGGCWSVTAALHDTSVAQRLHDDQVKLACALERLTHPNDTKLPNGQPNYYALFAPPLSSRRDDDQRDLKALGCSDWPQTVSFRDVSNASPPGEFSYAAEFLPPLSIGLAITLALTVAVYVVVRAVGWVIGGFAAS